MHSRLGVRVGDVDRKALRLTGVRGFVGDFSRRRPVGPNSSVLSFAFAFAFFFGVSQPCDARSSDLTFTLRCSLTQYPTYFSNIVRNLRSSSYWMAASYKLNRCPATAVYRKSFDDFVKVPLQLGLRVIRYDTKSGAHFRKRDVETSAVDNNVCELIGVCFCPHTAASTDAFV
ncbi:hypothetical protein HBI25_126490 [Parastagonospora nodorum]|nr:hypothetical protein HBI25_126490 [Parastagonospora nodorum]KAH6532548.1 hypothetical protein HBI81_089920 [Parastagonospora nodorum]